MATGEYLGKSDKKCWGAIKRGWQRWEEGWGGGGGRGVIPLHAQRFAKFTCHVYLKQKNP